MFRITLCGALLAATLLHAAPTALSRQPSETDAPFALVKDINTEASPISGMQSETLFEVVDGGRTTLFSATTPQSGKELWRTDGTEAGTQLIKDIQPGEGSALGYYVMPSVVLSDVLVFAADDGATGNELWRSDGTEAGTYLLKDLWPGWEGGNPDQFLLAGNKAFFTSKFRGTWTVLWVTDGTHAGTQSLQTFPNLGTLFVRSDGVLLFGATLEGDDFELWRSDGTPAGTVRVSDIQKGPVGSHPSGFIELPGTVVLFAADDGVHGRELWSTQGSAGDTVLIKDIAVGTFYSAAPEPVALLTTTTGDGANTSHQAMLSTIDPLNQVNVWITNGLPDSIVKNTRQVYAGATLPQAERAKHVGTITQRIGDSVYELALLSMQRPSSQNCLWISDGSAEGTKVLSEASPVLNSPRTIARLGESYFYPAVLGQTNIELWKSDGTVKGTVQVADIFAGEVGSLPQELTVLTDTLFFTADDGVHGRELFASAGSGARLVKDIWPGKAFGAQRILGVAHGQLYFIGNDGTSGGELWKTDGTEAGTVRVKNIAADVGGTDLFRGIEGANYAVMGDQLVFGTYSAAVISKTAQTANPSSADVNYDGQLWVSDGTTTGTTSILTFPSVYYGAMPHGLTTLHRDTGESTLFVGSESEDVFELWRTDGTSAGTAILTNTVASLFGTPQDVTALNDVAVFSVVTETTYGQGDTHYSLWRSDGTPAGTHIITTTVRFGEGDVETSGNTVFFSGWSLIVPGGRELWKTDGTEAGTVQVRDIVTASKASSNPRGITAGEPGQVFFTVNVSGTQLWKSDGTEAGTVLVRDIVPGDKKSEFGVMAYVSGTLFLAVDDGINGWELWKSDGTAAGTILVTDLFPGLGSSWPQDLVGMNGVLYFSATGPEGVRTLWHSDGTAAGTQPVRVGADVPINPARLTVAAGQLMFSAADAAHGREVWHSDGRAAGTVMLQDLVPGRESSLPQAFIATRKQVYLTAYTDQAGNEVWAMPLSEEPTPPAPQNRLLLPMTLR